MTKYSTMNIWGVIIAATIGSIIGSIILYSLGRLLNADKLERLFDSRLGKMLHLKKRTLKSRKLVW